MGKLLGLPMGMAPCYTLHSEITMEGQQIATELLTAAGANYFMDVYLTIDRMLAYFDTCGHDDQTLREIHGLTPAPEYLAWAMTRGIFTRNDDGEIERGPNWGNPKIFCASDAEFERLRANLPAALRLRQCAGRVRRARIARRSRRNLAAAREAIYAEVAPERLGGIDFRRIATSADSKESHLSHPDRGARPADQEVAALAPEKVDVQIIVSDGLSAEAVHHNIPDLLPALLDGLEPQKITAGKPILAPYGRVKLAEALGDALQPKLVINLIGERPGGDALASRSMSAYIAYRLGDAETTQRGGGFQRQPGCALRVHGHLEYLFWRAAADGGRGPDRRARQPDPDEQSCRQPTRARHPRPLAQHARGDGRLAFLVSATPLREAGRRRRDCVKGCHPGRALLRDPGPGLQPLGPGSPLRFGRDDKKRVSGATLFLSYGSGVSPLDLLSRSPLMSSTSRPGGRCRASLWRSGL